MIIFIDVDGVLVTNKTMLIYKNDPDIFDPTVVLLIKKILELTDSKLVITSHRSLDPSKFMELFNKNGISSDLFHPDFITPKKLTSHKTHEISWWLDDHPDVLNYIVIDDAITTRDRLHNIIYCNPHEGFSYRNFFECKQIAGLLKPADQQFLQYVKKYEIWNTVTPDNPLVHLTWNFADDLFK